MILKINDENISIIIQRNPIILVSSHWKALQPLTASVSFPNAIGPWLKEMGRVLHLFPHQADPAQPPGPASWLPQNLWDYEDLGRGLRASTFPTLPRRSAVWEPPV